MLQRALSLISAVFIAVPTAAAEDMPTSITGLIEMRADQPFLRMKTEGGPLALYGMTQELVSDLQKLKTGDLLVGHGRIYPDRRIVALDAIDTVGLRQILGAWRTASWKVFEFRDFNRLNLYLPTGTERATPLLAAPRQFNYTLAPDSGDTWSIFMADLKGVQIGSLQLGPRRMSLKIYDPRNGQIAEQHELAPFSRQ